MPSVSIGPTINYRGLTGLPQRGRRRPVEHGGAVRPRLSVGWLLLFVFCLGRGAGQAQSRSLPAQRIPATQPIVLDGALTEAIWQDAERAADFIQQEPRSGEPATERTEVRVLYDASHLYIGFVCDTHPSRILTTSLARDFNAQESDTVGILLDTFGDGRNGLLFVITPDGALRDVQVMNDGGNSNADWNAVWDARTQRTPSGWSAEVAIPFKTLRFPEAGTGRWGLNFNRRHRQNNEVSYWNFVPRPHGITRVSAAGSLTNVRDFASGRNLKLTPYVLGKGVDQRAGVDPDLQVGADLKYSLSTTTTLDVTLNTDFSETEVDARQVNLTRFPLFYPEKRQFFLENADLFHFGVRPSERGGGTSGEEYIGFFSRRIGLAPDGTPLPLLGGGRLTGRTGPYAYGLLQVSTRDNRDHPGSHYTVARGKRNLFGQSDGGLVMMNRQGAGADYSRIIGGDLNLQFGRLNLTSFLSKSFSPQDTGRTHAGKLFVGWADPRLEVFGTWIEVGRDYDRSMSYIPRRDIRMFRGEINWKYRPKMRFIRELHPHATQRYVLNGASELRTKKQHLGLWVNFHDGSRVEIYQQREFERLERGFDIERGVRLPPGDYAFNSWVSNFVFNPTRILSGSAKVQRGAFWNGTLDGIDTRLALRVRPKFLMEGRYALNKVELRDGTFDTHLTSLRLHHAFNTRQFLDLLVQYSSQDEVFSYQGRYNLIHRPLSDLFIVVSEQRGYELDQRVRSIAVKFNRLLDF